MSKVTGIFLAAGFSRRMGMKKMDLPLGHSSLAGLSLSEVLHSELDRIIVVVNNETAPWLEKFKNSASNRLRVVVCSTSHLGQSESIKHGIGQLADDEDAFMILLADQPFFPASAINQLIGIYKEKQGDFAASRFEGVARPPAIFPARMKSFFAQISGDIGARQIFKSKDFNGIYVDFNQPLYFLDVDTQEDFQKAKSVKEDF